MQLGSAATALGLDDGEVVTVAGGEAGFGLFEFSTSELAGFVVGLQFGLGGTNGSQSSPDLGFDGAGELLVT